jgi:two-component system, chemotaxis family, chemotaxis protein CheY
LIVVLENLSMKRFLVVDDSSVVRNIAKRILKGLDFEVSEAADGSLALDACRTDMPDAILLDWHMPVLDGLGFLQRLRAEPGGTVPKVIFCTTETDVSHITQAMSAGADEYIMKPFDTQIIRSKLEEIGLV